MSKLVSKIQKSIRQLADKIKNCGSSPRELLLERRGFTLIEMLVVIGIVGVLASLVLVGLGPSRQASRDTKLMSNLHQIQNLLEVSYLRSGGYPSSLNFTSGDYSKVTGSESSKYCYVKSNNGYIVGVQLEGTQTGGADCGSCSTPPITYCLSAE